MIPEGRLLLSRFMRMFERIIQYTKINKMTASSLAICLGMNLVHPKDPMESLSVSQKVNKIFEAIIENSSIIFPTMNYKESKFDDIFDAEFDDVSKMSFVEDDEDEESIEFFNPLFDPEEVIEQIDRQDWIRDSLFIDTNSSLEDKLNELREKINSFRKTNVSTFNLSDLQKQIQKVDRGEQYGVDEFEIEQDLKTNQVGEFEIGSSSGNKEWEFEFSSPVPEKTEIEGNDVFTAEQIKAHKHRSFSRRIKKGSPSPGYQE
jgi:hypothetical protein